MKQSGKCQKCNSTEIFHNEDKGIAGIDGKNVDAWGGFYMATYVCMGCGYIEEYIKQSHLKDQKRMDKVRKKWKKVFRP